MMKKKRAVYNPEIELAKGATLDAAAYDKTQKIKVTAAKVTVGGIPGGGTNLLRSCSAPVNTAFSPRTIR